MLSVVFLLLAVLASAHSIFFLTYFPKAFEALKSGHLFSANMLNLGGVPAFFDILFSLSGLLVVLSSRQYLKREYAEHNEYYSILLFSIIGMMLIAHSANMLVLFVGIETMSVCFYILSGFIRTREHSVEAAVKYFLLGAFATGFLVYGMALLYGSTATMNFSLIGTYLQSAKSIPFYFPMGIGLLIVGLTFKVAAFPFHQWAPDVYHGSPTVVSAFMSTAGKAAALSGFIAVALPLMPMTAEFTKIVNNTHTVQTVIAVIAAATMLIANFTALVQKNVKRMLSFSSVAHAGYLLMGITANNADGRIGIAFYASAYMFMQIGAFIIISVIERGEESYQNLSDFAGLRKTHPWLAAIMAIFMFSLAGIPPFAGFIGKYYLFVAAVKADFTWLTIVAVISSIISMYYYIGLVLQMYFKEPGENEVKADIGTAGITLTLATAGTVIFGIFPSFIIDVISKFF